jgi:hypothetical protein
LVLVKIMYINIINVGETVIICFVFKTIKIVHINVVIIHRVQTSVLP